MRTRLRTLANVPTQCRKVHADCENSCIARAVNDSLASWAQRHVHVPRTNLRIAVRRRAMNRATTDANGRQHGISTCSHQRCDLSHYAGSQLPFEHTSRLSVRRIETTNGRWHLPSVGVFAGGGRRIARHQRPEAEFRLDLPAGRGLQRGVAICTIRHVCDLTLRRAGGRRSDRATEPTVKNRRRRRAFAPALSASAVSSTVFALARPTVRPQMCSGQATQ